MKRLAVSTAIAALLSALAALPATADPIDRELAAQPSLDMIGWQAAWDADITGDGVVIGIADEQVDLTHPEFAGRVSPYPMISRSLAGMEHMWLALPQPRRTARAWWVLRPRQRSMPCRC